MDIASTDGTAAFIDVEPGTIDGNSGLNIYRVVAGGQGSWGSANGGYQDFYVQVKTAQGVRENFAVIFLAHIDNFRYSNGTIIAGPTSQRSTVVVADVAPTGYWPQHIHIEGYNYNYWARTYNWDGPTTDDDATQGPPCLRPGGSPSQCNAEVYGSDVIGYVGGNKPSFAQVANPYFQEF